MTTWNKRYKKLTELLPTPPEGRKQVIEELEDIAKTKDLSFGERKMLDQAKNWDQYMAEHRKKVVDLEEFVKRKLG